MCTVCVELRAPSVDITCLQSENVRLKISKALIVDISVLRDTMSRWVVISLFPNFWQGNKILYIVRCQVNCCRVRCHVNRFQVRCLATCCQ